MSDAQLPQGWACQVDADHLVRFEDLLISEWAEISTRADVAWGTLFTSPLFHAEGVQAIYDVCCRKAGVEPHPLTVKEATIDVFKLVPEDLPQQFEDGIPDPKAEEVSTAS